MMLWFLAYIIGWLCCVAVLMWLLALSIAVIRTNRRTAAVDAIITTTNTEPQQVIKSTSPPPHQLALAYAQPPKVHTKIQTRLVAVSCCYN